MLVAALLAGPAAGHAIAASAASAPDAAATPWTPDVRAATSFAQRRSGRYASRHTPDEVQEWCATAGLEVDRFDVSDAAISVLARRPD
jgi:hypothetical protein